MYQDLRKCIPKPNSWQEEYFFPRPSSQTRIIVNTAALTFCGFFYGIGRALYANKSQFKYSAMFGTGTLVAGLMHQTLNEVFTGMLIRKYQCGQYWATNTAAGLITCMAVYATLQIRNPSYRKFLISQYFAGSICVMSIFLDMVIQMSREKKFKE